MAVTLRGLIFPPRPSCTRFRSMAFREASPAAKIPAEAQSATDGATLQQAAH